MNKITQFSGLGKLTPRAIRIAGVVPVVRRKKKMIISLISFFFINRRSSNIEMKMAKIIIPVLANTSGYSFSCSKKD
jgi:hypothetical protein